MKRNINPVPKKQQPQQQQQQQQQHQVQYFHLKSLVPPLIMAALVALSPICHTPGKSNEPIFKGI